MIAFSLPFDYIRIMRYAEKLKNLFLSRDSLRPSFAGRFAVCGQKRADRLSGEHFSFGALYVDWT
jgi:hypothetical protein